MFGQSRTLSSGVPLCYADDTMVLIRAATLIYLEWRTNQALRLVADWIKKAGLDLAVEKSEAVTFTSKYKMKNPRIVQQGKVVNHSQSIKYLGLTLDRNSNFTEHLGNAAKKTEGIVVALGCLMPNPGGPREKRWKLLASVVHSVLLYGAPVWAPVVHWVPGHLGELRRVQQQAALWCVAAYRTVSYESANMLAGIPPIEFPIEERWEIYHKKKDEQPERWKKKKKKIQELIRLRTITQLEEKLVQSKKGRWTRRLIPDVAALVGWRHGDTER